jgi:D-alanyl-lipoteichoic acid acyltransferase DltB (MBOAT superfamily)
MVFNSLEFVGFFLVVYALYRWLPHRAQNWMLVAASYYFYAAWDWRFLGLLIGSTVVDFFVGRYLGREPAPGSSSPQRRRREGGRRRLALILSLVFNLGMIGVFKYFNFFADSLVRVFSWIGWRVDPVTVNVILPIGISFYTFMTISYVIDVYRRDIRPTSNFIDFALFVGYFPHLVAGPILRASLLLPQIARPRVITQAQIVEGLWLAGWGYFQKMFVADNLARLVAAVFGPGATPTGLDVLIAIYAFAFQIYGDFAGYSNIARGISKLMGIELNVNFLFPYFVVSPQEFWRNWHISLSTWLRDYLYIPLGGNRGSSLATKRNLLITMVLGGLWHGAAWTFVLWGVYQGLALVVARTIQEWSARAGVTIGRGLTWPRVALGVLMFQVTCFGWLIFRAESVAQVARFSHVLATDFHPGPSTVRSLLIPFLEIVAPLLVVHIYQARHGSESAPLSLRTVTRYALYGAVGYLILLFGDFEGAQFIYFQF